MEQQRRKDYYNTNAYMIKSITVMPVEEGTWRGRAHYMLPATFKIKSNFGGNSSVVRSTMVKKFVGRICWWWKLFGDGII